LVYFVTFFFFFFCFLIPFLKLFNREWNINSNFISEKNKQAKLFFFPCNDFLCIYQKTPFCEEMEKKVKKNKQEINLLVKNL